MTLSITIEIESISPLLFVEAKDFSKSFNTVTRKVKARLPNVNLIVWQRITLVQGEGEHRVPRVDRGHALDDSAGRARRRHYTDRSERNQARTAFRSAIGSTVIEPVSVIANTFTGWRAWPDVVESAADPVQQCVQP